MKQFVVLLILMCAVFASDAQILQMSYYHKNSKTDYTIFRIEGKNYTFLDGEFYKGDSVIFRKPANTLVHFEVYNHKYLFASIFDSTDEAIMSAAGYNVRLKKHLYVVSLRKPHKTWFFDCKMKFNSLEIELFDPEKGELIVQPKPKKIRLKSE
jgi:hypothetical protein